MRMRCDDEEGKIQRDVYHICKIKTQKLYLQERNEARMEDASPTAL